ncbi:hypothetical protein Gotri_011228 [Gossypium trilobum]|uniref:Pectate lyase n=1 Tax=Gossypium trilobum TaxID=34281 RepID=A0A7J9ETK0_9ROSI|nr:hypothetical protein [Gossypium trilobum]
MCIIFEDGLNDEIRLAIVLSVENNEEVPVRLPTTLIVAGDEILTGKRTGRSCPTVSLDLLVVLPVERVDLIVTSDKTINARVANVEICNGAGITVQFVKNVIIHGLQIHHNIPAKGGKIKDGENHHGLRGASDGDEVSLFRDTNVSFDHLPFTIAPVALSMSFKDPLQLPFLIAISLTTTIADKKMQVTVALNHFGKGLVERMPRCRFGFVHVINNNYNHWFLYAISGTSHITNISQGNRYYARDTFGAKEVTCRGL